MRKRSEPDWHSRYPQRISAQRATPVFQPSPGRRDSLGSHCSRDATAMSENSRNQAYIDHVRRLEQRIDGKDEAMRLAVGGEFDAVGKLEYYLLRSLGLSNGHLVIDVGCGSGRLA